MKSVIFDMDGVLVNSEPLWQRAEKEIFTSLGVAMNAQLCEQTQKMTTNEAAKFWYKITPWGDNISIEKSEIMVIDRVISLIESEDCAIPGIARFIENLKKSDIQIGLATNSPYDIIPVVLKKLDLVEYFDTICSSEHVKRGKPMPDVYLKALERLNEKPTNSLAIEDSNSGIRAAKRAGMKVAAFTNRNKNLIIENVDLSISDFKRINYERLLSI